MATSPYPRPSGQILPEITTSRSQGSPKEMPRQAGTPTDCWPMSALAKATGLAEASDWWPGNVPKSSFWRPG